MLQNYLLIAWRNLIRHKTFSLINILGLAVGMAACLLILQYLHFERSYESFHENADRIYRLTVDVYDGSELAVQDAQMYRPAGPMMVERIPEVIDFARMNPFEMAEFRKGDQAFKESKVMLADSSCFRLFSFRFLHGNPEKALTEPMQIVLTAAAAIKYFGETDIVGQSLEIQTADELRNLTVVGVIEDLPAQTHLKTDIHLYSDKTFETEPNGDASLLLLLGAVALIILLVAWVNYINLATARALERAREVGIRKVVGSSRRQLVGQFMLEAGMIHFIAGLIALSLIQVSLPNFRMLASLPVDFHFLTEVRFVSQFSAMILVSWILAGFYPAFVLSGFRPIAILNGRFRHSSHGTHLRKALVVFQFVMAVVLIAGALAVNRQLSYLRNMDLGVNIEQTLVVAAPQADSALARFGMFRDELLRNPHIREVSASTVVPGLSTTDMSSTNGIQLAGSTERQNQTFYLATADDHFIDLLGIELLAGLNFPPKRQEVRDVLINAEAARRFGIDQPEAAVGRKIDLWGTLINIRGVMADFHQISAKNKPLPLIILQKETDFSFASIGVQTEDMPRMIEQIRTSWTEAFPGSAFSYFFLDEKYDQQYHADERFSRIFGVLTGLAILIACLGLFGLSTYTATQRTREISIRKVCGATTLDIARLLSKNYLQLILLASGIGLPLAAWGIRNWLQSFATQMPLNPWLFILPVVIILVIATVTISWQIIRSANSNPADALHSE